MFIIATMRTVQRTNGRAVPALWRDGALLGVAVALPGVSFGALTIAAELPLWMPVAMSVLVFAGGSQFAAVGVLAAGGGVVPAVLTGLLLNLRLLPYGLTMARTIDPSTGLDGAQVHRRPWRRWLLPHLLVDESVGLAQSRHDPQERRAAFLLGGAGVFVGWNLGVLAGVAVGQVLADPERLGLDAALPAVLLALIVAAVRSPAATPAPTGGGADRHEPSHEPSDEPGAPTVDPIPRHRPGGRGGLDIRLALAAATGAAIGIAGRGVLPPGLDVVAGLAGGLVVLLPRRGERPSAVGTPGPVGRDSRTCAERS